MKKLFILLLTVFTFYSFTYSQGCLPDGITFTTQQQIDDFQANYPGCTEIEGSVWIFGITNTITNLDGLNIITLIGGDLIIHLNQGLINLSGLENLMIVNGRLELSYNINLLVVSGLFNLNTISNGLTIYGNNALENLDWLSSLTSLTGNLNISANGSLESILGLDNLTLANIDTLWIYDNFYLTDCMVQSICDFISNPNGPVNINYNGYGCRSLIQFSEACGTTLSCLPYGNYYFSSQEELDAFQNYFPGCTDLAGNLTLSFNISDMSGLSMITSIEQDLIIEYNDITNVDGLSNLNSIGKDLSIYDNSWLDDLNGLSALSAIGGKLKIENNTYLTSLNGLDDIAPASITELTIIGNFSLSQCHVESVCGYLSTPNAVTDIYLNADGCKSENEILDLCVSGEEEIYDCNNSFYFYPNPAADIIYFENFHSNCVLKFYDQSGQLLRTETLPHSELDISPFDPGLYYFEILSAKEIIRRKLIIK